VNAMKNETVGPGRKSKHGGAKRPHVLVLPFMYPGLLLLQLTGIAALAVATYLGPSAELGFIGVDFYSVEMNGQDIAEFVNIGIGITAGAALAVLSSLREKMSRVRKILQYVVLGISGFIGGFFVFSMFLHLVPEALYLGFMEWLIPYASGVFLVLIFAGPVMLGVYGLLMGRTDLVMLSLASIFLSMFTAFSAAQFALGGEFTLVDQDLTGLFLNEIEITIFSISFFVFAEIGLSVGNFTRKLGEVSLYDRSRDGSTGKEFSSMLTGVAAGYVPYMALFMAFTFVFALFSFSADTMFQPIMTESLKNAIEHRTIYGKILFTLIMFGMLAVIRGFIPAIRPMMPHREAKEVNKEVKIEWHQ